MLTQTRSTSLKLGWLNFKQQQPQQLKTTQLKYENSTKESKLHFNDIQYIYIYIYSSYICYS